MFNTFGRGSATNKNAADEDFLVEAGQTGPALDKTRAELLQRYAEMVFEMDQRSLNEVRAREQKMWLAAGAGLVILFLALMAWVSSLVFFATSRAQLPRIIHSLKPTAVDNATESATTDDAHAELFELVASRGGMQVSLEDAKDRGPTRRPCLKNCSGRASMRPRSGDEPSPDDTEDAVLALSREVLRRDYRKSRNSGGEGGPSSEAGRNIDNDARDPDHVSPTDPVFTFLDGWQGNAKSPRHTIEEGTHGNFSRVCGETCNETTFFTKTGQV